MSRALGHEGWKELMASLAEEIQTVRIASTLERADPYDWNLAARYRGRLPGHQAVFRYLQQQSISILQFQKLYLLKSTRNDISHPKMPKNKTGIRRDIAALDDRLTGALAEYIPAVRAIMDLML